MRTGTILLRAGALGLAASLGALFQEPLWSYWKGDRSAFTNLFLLYGFPGTIGLLLPWIRSAHWEKWRERLWVGAHAAAIVAMIWLVLWCFVWLAMLSNYGERSTMLIKHSAYLHLFGVGFSMAGYATGWLTRSKSERTLRFLMVPAWASAYMALFNLYLQPTLSSLWAGAAGGITVVAACFLVQRALKSPVEAAVPPK